MQCYWTYNYCTNWVSSGPKYAVSSTTFTMMFVLCSKRSGDGVDKLVSIAVYIYIYTSVHRYRYIEPGVNRMWSCQKNHGYIFANPTFYLHQDNDGGDENVCIQITIFIFIYIYIWYVCPWTSISHLPDNPSTQDLTPSGYWISRWCCWSPPAAGPATSRNELGEPRNGGVFGGKACEKSMDDWGFALFRCVFLRSKSLLLKPWPWK